MQWVAPKRGWVKINWDASCAKGKGWIGFGVLIRDEQGKVLATKCLTMEGNMEASVAEARGALLAVHLCKTLGLNRVHLEGDAQVINAVNSSVLDWNHRLRFSFLLHL